MTKLAGIDPTKMAQSVELVAISDLVPYEKNTRVHKKVQVEQIMDSIIEFGFTSPILISDKNGILAGHGRLMAAQKLKLDKVPVIRLDYLTEDQQRAYVIADNKIAENAEWDYPLLTQELKDLEELDFDIGKLGFSVGELDDLLNLDTEPAPAPKVKKEKEQLPDQPITKRGDVWVLGEHRLVCGFPVDVEFYDQLLCQAKVNMVITKLQTNDIANCRQVYSDTFSIIDFNDYNSIYCFVADKELHSARAAFDDNDFTWSDYLVWNKSKPEHHSKDYDSKHELIIYGYRSKHKFYGGSKSISSFSSASRAELAEELISHGSKRNENIYDPFAGDGSILIACEKKNRRCFAMEMKEQNCDAIIMAWQNYTRQNAILDSTGETYNELVKSALNSTRDSQEA